MLCQVPGWVSCDGLASFPGGVITLLVLGFILQISESSAGPIIQGFYDLTFTFHHNYTTKWRQPDKALLSLFKTNCWLLHLSELGNKLRDVAFNTSKNCAMAKINILYQTKMVQKAIPLGDTYLGLIQESIRGV